MHHTELSMGSLIYKFTKKVTEQILRKWPPKSKNARFSTKTAAILKKCENQKTKKLAQGLDRLPDKFTG